MRNEQYRLKASLVSARLGTGLDCCILSLDQTDLLRTGCYCSEHAYRAYDTHHSIYTTA